MKDVNFTGASEMNSYLDWVTVMRYGHTPDWCSDFVKRKNYSLGMGSAMVPPTLNW